MFNTIASDLLSRGFSIIPLLPKAKSPNVAIGSGTSRRTRDKSIIDAWGQAEPNGNVGVCSDSDITILESDDEVRLRDLIRQVTIAKYGTALELPDTLTSQARANRPHFFFRQTEKSRGVKGSPAVQGIFEWRHDNQYVVGPGSVHPTGVTYQIVRDVPIADMPDWLVDTLLSIRDANNGEHNLASNFVAVGAAGICKQKYLGEYVGSLDAMLGDTEFNLIVAPGERHNFLVTMAGILHDGTRDEDELAADLIRLRDAYCVASDRTIDDVELHNLAEWALRRPPCDVEPDLPTTNLFTNDVADLPATPLLSHADLRLQSQGEVDELVEGLFPAQSVNIIVGDSGLGKTPLVMQLAACVALGKDFIDIRVRQGKVLIVDYENFADLCPTIDSISSLLGGPENIPDSHLRIMQAPSDMTKVLDAVDSWKPDLVIVDSLRGFNSQAEMKPEAAASLITTLQLRKACFLMIHHVRKNGTEKGANRKPLIKEPHVINWLENASGARALINQTRVRIAVDFYEPDNGDNDDLALRAFYKGRGELGPWRLIRVANNDGEYVGYKRATGVEMLDAEMQEWFKALPKNQPMMFGGIRTTLKISPTKASKFIHACGNVGLVKATGARSTPGRRYTFSEAA